MKIKYYSILFVSKIKFRYTFINIYYKNSSLNELIEDSSEIAFGEFF